MFLGLPARVTMTMSVFDTFTGDAVSGPLGDQGVSLEETTVVRSTWGDWKAQHPDTKIVARDGGIGRSYELDPLGGRDDDGPIFPVGPVDERLAAHFLAPRTLPASVVLWPISLIKPTASSGVQSALWA